MNILAKDLRDLLVAAELGNVERMRSLLSATQQYDMTHDWLTQSDKKDRTPLHLASIWGYKDVVSFIVDEIIDVLDDDEKKKYYLNLKDYKGRTPLFHAVAEERNSVAEVLVEKGASLEESTNEKHIEPGSTPLMACAEKNNREGFCFLLNSGADLLATRNDGADATYIAARYGHLSILEDLEEYGKVNKIVKRGTFRGRSALMTAALHGHLNVCKFLFQHGAVLNHQDDDKFTALMFASSNGYIELVKWLLCNGAKTNLKASNGDTAMKLADANGYDEILKCLKMYQGNDHNTNNVNVSTVVNAKNVPKKLIKGKEEKIAKLPKKEPIKKISR